MMYDLVIVGSGLYGAVSAYLARERGLRCVVLESRQYVGGNVRDELTEGIRIHKYGPHIFHTNDRRIWTFSNHFIDFNSFRYCPLAHDNGKLYHLPFNMNTFYEVFGTQTPKEAMEQLRIEHEKEYYEHPQNLEEQAISLVGRTLYELLIKGYTEKQWGRSATDLPVFIIKRIPLRFSYDNNYFNDIYQGIPIGGYTTWIKKMLEGVEIKLCTNFLNAKKFWMEKAKKIIYTGSIDTFYDYQFGTLEYRSLKFEEELYEIPNYQGCAAINETNINIPYTRSIEHKHFEFGEQPVTVITREYPTIWNKGDNAYYPINDERNNNLYLKYKSFAKKQNPNVIFGGRLGDYQYYNMDQVIRKALDCFPSLMVPPDNER
jgi:UDP-galactopyranose mutase